MLSGIFVSNFDFTKSINAATLSEARWVLIAISPVLLMVNFVWLRSTPAKGIINTSLQTLGQTALFLAPYYWVFNNV